MHFDAAAPSVSLLCAWPAPKVHHLWTGANPGEGHASKISAYYIISYHITVHYIVSYHIVIILHCFIYVGKNEENKRNSSDSCWPLYDLKAWWSSKVRWATKTISVNSLNFKATTPSLENAVATDSQGLSSNPSHGLETSPPKQIESVPWWFLRFSAARAPETGCGRRLFLTPHGMPKSKELWSIAPCNVLFSKSLRPVHICEYVF